MNIVSLKKILFLILVMVMSQRAWAQDYSNPELYHNLLLAEQVKVINDNMGFISNFLFDLETKRDQEKRQVIIDHLDASISRLDAMPSFHSDIHLKETALNVFKAFKRSYEAAYRLADSLNVSDRSSYSTIKQYIEIQENNEELLHDAGKEFIKTQRNFLKKNDLDKEKAMCLFSEIAEVNAYCRKVYLSYLTVSNVNAGFFEAMKRKQSSAMEKNRQEIIEVANQTMASLQETGPFEGQDNYLNKGISLTNYIKKMAEEEFSELVQITDKQNASFDDANKFNKMVINYYKQTKELVKEFHTACADLMQNSISHEAQVHLAHQSPQGADILTQIDANPIHKVNNSDVHPINLRGIYENLRVEK